MAKSSFSVFATRCSGALARWLLPLLVHLGLFAARRQALADKGSAVFCGYLGQFDSGLSDISSSRVAV